MYLILKFVMSTIYLTRKLIKYSARWVEAGNHSTSSSIRDVLSLESFRDYICMVSDNSCHQPSNRLEREGSRRFAITSRGFQGFALVRIPQATKQLIVPAIDRAT